jgi:hypothetical protein
MRISVVALAFVLLAAFVRVLPAGAATGPIFNPGVTNPGPGGGSTPPGGSGNGQLQVTNGVPVLTAISPTSAVSGSNGVTLTLSGANFSGNSTIMFGGLTVSASSVTPTVLTAVIPSSALRNPGAIPVFVMNPPPGGGVSATITFTVSGVSNPAPSISGVTPSSMTAGSPATRVTVTGTGFTSSTTATLGGVPGTVAGNTITFNLTAALIANPTSLSGLISNPSPGGGAQSFLVTITSPIPTVTGFSPGSANAGSATASIQVSGTNFITGAAITFSGTPLPTTFNSATSLSATLPATFLQAAGNFSIGVTNPGPGGSAASAAATFRITNPPPVLTNVAPAQIPAATVATTVTLIGTGFAGNSAAMAGTTPLATTYVSATSLAVTIPPSLLKAGTLPITVANPAPGGGTSGAIPLAVGNPVPVVTGVSPAALTSNQANAVLVVTGRNFVANAVVALGGAGLPTTFVSSTQVTAQPQAPMPLGTQPVTVTNPAPGGGPSNAVTIQISSLLPTITAAAPASVGGGQTVTVTGTNFVPGTRVLFNGTQIPTTAMSTTQVTATIPLTAASGPASIVVQNPATSTSAAQNSTAFTIQTVSAGPTPPVLSGISPSTVPARTAATITVTGTNFVSGAQISVGQQLITPAMSNATTMVATVTIPAAGNVNVSVTNPGGLRSNVMTFASLGPAPLIVNFAPRTGSAGTIAVIEVVGQNFAAGAQLSFGGQLITPLQLTATMLGVKLTLPAAGAAALRIVNPGNQQSNDVFFQVTPP